MRAFIAYGTCTHMHTHTHTHSEGTQQELHNLIKQNQAWPQQTAQSHKATQRQSATQTKGIHFTRLAKTKRNNT